MRGNAIASSSSSYSPSAAAAAKDRDVGGGGAGGGVCSALHPSTQTHSVRPPASSACCPGTPRWSAAGAVGRTGAVRDAAHGAQAGALRGEDCGGGGGCASGLSVREGKGDGRRRAWATRELACGDSGRAGGQGS